MLRDTLPGLMVAVLWVSVAMAGSLPASDRSHYEKLEASLRLKAEQGDADAQYALGDMYYRGEGIEQNPAEAAHWYRMAAEQGLAGAQFDLGDMYYHGDGIDQNRAEAAHWYRMAAEQGQLAAQFQLGRIYSVGSGVPQDRVLAHKWLNLAADQEHPGASQELDTLAAFMTPDEIVQAQGLAREWASK